MKKTSFFYWKMFYFLFFVTVIISSSSYAMEASKIPSDTSKKAIILSFYEHLRAKNVEERVKSLEHFDSNYKDHDPFLSGGKESLRKVIEQNPIEANVKRIFLDGDYVIAHVHYLTHPGTHGQAGIDIFRFENERIIEHWNVLQAVPVKPINTHDIF